MNAVTTDAGSVGLAVFPLVMRVVLGAGVEAALATLPLLAVATSSVSS